MGIDTPGDPEGRKTLMDTQQFDEAFEVIRGPTTERVHAIKPQLSLIQAKEILQGRVDFEKLQDGTARNFERWGLGAGFTFKDDMAVGDSGDENQLKALFERDRKPPSTLVIPGGLKPAKLLDILFVRVGIPMNRDSYGFKNLDVLREINPRNVPGFAALHKLSRQEQMGVFKAAYKKAPDLGAGGPRILFIDGSLHTRQAVGVSATDMLQRAAAGQAFWFDPATEYVRARQQVDAALQQVVGEDMFEGFSTDEYRSALANAFKQKTIDRYMPAWGDGVITRNPLHVFPDGSVSAFCWYPDFRCFFVGSYMPANADDDLCGRASLA